jgi:uncharacterized Zn finger protein (UPF0148 family)
MKRDRSVTCPGCGNTFDFAVTMDQSNKNSRVSLILPRGAFKTEGESLAMHPPAAAPAPAPEEEPAAEFEAVEEPEPEAAPPPPPPPIPRKSNTIQILMGHCECGSVFPLEDNGELTSIQSCPTCQRAYHVVFKLEPGTRQKTAIIVPQKPLMHRRMVTTPPKAPKGATKAGKTVAPPAKARTKVGNTKVIKPPPPAPKAKAPVEIPVGAQAVPCGCGETFYVRRKDLGQELTCAGCGRKARFEESRHPQTLAPTLRIKQD